jgi:REP element-mobilizing transposase RayT
MREAAVSLNPTDRGLVLDAIGEACVSRGWTLWAAHVRENHVHAVVAAGVPSGHDRELSAAPERVMTDLKAFASKKLNGGGPRMRWWARHGSTRYLWGRKALQGAIVYVYEGQGAPMARYVNPEW